MLCCVVLSVCVAAEGCVGLFCNMLFLSLFNKMIRSSHICLRKKTSYLSLQLRLDVPILRLVRVG
jgi:hypothetical protein